jgi:hypothetical protein
MPVTRKAVLKHALSLSARRRRPARAEGTPREMLFALPLSHQIFFTEGIQNWTREHGSIGPGSYEEPALFNAALFENATYTSLRR